MRILLKGPGSGREVLPDVNPAMTYADFQALVASKTKLAVKDQCLLVGFPAKEIVASPSAEVQTVLKNGDTVLVKQAEDDDGTPQANVQGSGWEHLPSIPQNTGMMVRRDMPRDNACMFHSIVHVCEEGKMSVAGLRELIANVVASNPKKYDATFLGCPSGEYQRQIMNPDQWGGAIELSILSTHYQCEIVAFDFHFLREDVYGEGQGYKARVFLIYSGDHYDAMVFQPGVGNQITKFSSGDMYAWERARHHAQFLHLEAVRAGQCTEVKAWRHDKPTPKTLSKPSPLPKKATTTTTPAPTTASSAPTNSPPKTVQKGKDETKTTATPNPKPSSSPVSPPPGASPSASEETKAVTFHTGEAAAEAGEDWICTCTLKNPASSSTCEACGLVKGADRVLERWQCMACTFSNDPFKPRCEMCQTPNPNPAIPEEDPDNPPPQQAPPETLIEPFNPFASLMAANTTATRPSWGPPGGPPPAAGGLFGVRWQCPRCNTSNTPGLMMCRTCRAPNMMMMDQPQVCSIS